MRRWHVLERHRPRFGRRLHVMPSRQPTTAPTDAPAVLASRVARSACCAADSAGGAARRPNAASSEPPKIVPEKSDTTWPSAAADSEYE